MLLSFAQFEREVTGERIRDKIAASKQKGMWMGGVPPLGYSAVRGPSGQTQPITLTRMNDRFCGLKRTSCTELDISSCPAEFFTLCPTIDWTSRASRASMLKPARELS